MSKNKKSILCLLVFAMLFAAICCFAGCKDNGGTPDCDNDGHKWVKVDEVAPTCEIDGTKEHYKCSECGKIALFDGKDYVVVESEALAVAAGHSWGDEIQTVAATCEKEGVKAHYECDKCHKLAVYENGGFAVKTAEELALAKAEHNWGSLIEGVPPVCDKEGTLSHYECSVCHSLAVKEGDEYVIKTEAELKITSTGAHKWGAPIAETPATCGKAGLKARYECADCHSLAVKEGDEYVIKTEAELTIAATGAHVWGGYIDETPATCEHTGTKGHYECNVCGFKAVKEGENYVVKTDEELILPTAEHTWGDEIQAVAATCTNDGVKAHYECSVCHAEAINENGAYTVVSDGDLIIPAAHKWGEFIGGTAATCTNDGVKAHYECEICGLYAECDSVGNIVDIVSDYNLLIIPHGHRFAFNSARNAYVCGDCGATLAAVSRIDVNLDIHDEGGAYVSADENMELNVEGFGLTAVIGISADGAEISDYTLTGGNLTIPYSAFEIGNGRFPYGEKKIVVTGKTGRDYEVTIDYPVLFKTKIIKTIGDLQQFGMIATLQEDNSGKSSDKEYSYGGYFELGADIDANGKRYSMVSSASKQVSSTTGGFKGVFDGKGYAIKNLLIGAERVWYNGCEDTEDNLWKNYSFIGRLDGGKIKNVNFTGVKLNPISSVICSSGYGEISNIYAQIARCAILKDVDPATGELRAYTPLGFSFSQGTTNADSASIHEVIVDFGGCEYCALDKGVPVSNSSELASYDFTYGFIDNPNVYNVFGKNVTKLENCFVIGYPVSAISGATVYASFGAMNVSQSVADKFDSAMFKLKDGMLLPKQYADIYDGLPSEFTVTATESKVMKGGKVKVNLDGLERLVEFVSDTDKITFANGYVYFDESLTGEVSFRFRIKNKTSTTVTVTILTEGDLVDLEIAEWENNGATKIGSALNSSVVAEKLGNQNVYKTGGGWNVNIANADVNAANYKEFGFLYKTSVSVNLGSSQNKNQNKANVWYYVKLVKNLDGSWSIFAKTLTEANYTQLEASAEYFASDKSFTDMFKTWLWGSSGYDVYATDVWGVAYLPYEGVQSRIEALPAAANTVDEINNALAVYDAYASLADDQKSLIASAQVTKLNSIVQSIFAKELSAFETAGASKTQNSALKGSSVKSDTIGGYDIYKLSDIPGSGGQQAGVGLKMNDYDEIYFAYKATASVAIFSGTNSPMLSANKWYSIKLVKGAENWTVYFKAFGETEYTPIDLGTTVISSVDGSSVQETVWFNTKFITAQWKNAADVYDVYAVGLWTKAYVAEEYEKVEEVINALPDAANTVDEVNNVFAAESAYNALTAEQKEKVSTESVKKLNDLLGAIFKNEIEVEANGANVGRAIGNANYAATSDSAYGGYNVYKVSGLNKFAGHQIGVEINVVGYSEVYFAIKLTDKVAVFDGYNNPTLDADKWYSIKLLKSGDCFLVWYKAFGDSEYNQIKLGENVEIKADEWGNIKFNAIFKTVDWSNKNAFYDVYATDLWVK